MSQYRKKPVVIDAERFTGLHSAGRIVLWVGEGGGEARLRPDPPGLLIDTLEGTMAADPGDWIIRGVAGEFYPCKPDIFEQTYEAVYITKSGKVLTDADVEALSVADAQPEGVPIHDAVAVMRAVVAFADDPNLPAAALGPVVDRLIAAATAFRAVTHP